MFCALCANMCDLSEIAHVFFILGFDCHFLPYLVVFMSQQLKSNVKSKVPKAQQQHQRQEKGNSGSEEGERLMMTVIQIQPNKGPEKKR